MAKQSAEDIAHAAKLAARRARRERKKAKAQDEAEDAAVSLRASLPAPAIVKQEILGGPTEQALMRGSMPPKRITEAREHLTNAFDMLGGVPALVLWGQRNPTEFYRIWARLLPKEIPQDPTDKIPLETLLGKLSERAEMSVEQAAREIGAETLATAEAEVNMEDAVAAFNGGSVH